MIDGGQIRRARPGDLELLVALWERSVRATHNFLTEADIASLRPQVGDALRDDGLDLWVLVDSWNAPVGFMGVIADDISALFIDPAERGRGAGRRLVAHAQALRGGKLTVDVNEQNGAARGFYGPISFDAFAGARADEDVRQFLLLHLRRAEPPP